MWSIGKRHQMLTPPTGGLLLSCGLIRRLSFISKVMRTILMSAYVHMRPCERTLLPPSQVVRATEELICDASIRSQGRLGL